MTMIENPDPGLTYLTIDDFRPGIVSQAKYAYGASDNSAPVPWLGKPGAAQENGTVGCIALANGGLAPLPGISKTVSSGYAVPGGATAWINGVNVHSLASGSSVGFSNDEIVYGFEIKQGTTRTFELNSWLDAAAVTTVIFQEGPATDTSTAGINALSSGLTRVNPTAPLQPGQPCLSLSYTFAQDAGAISYNWLYPNPSSPGVVGLYTFVPSYNSLTLTHQNRVVELTLDNYPWIGTIGGVTTLFPTNETFNYTDPPNSNVMGAQNEVFVEEYPSGVGAWGSISAGELFLVKQAGGAFIVSGDLNSPTITFLGGVTPTYGTINHDGGAQTLQGLVYASDFNGVWAWQGGMTSQKLSGNLNDDFWMVPTEGGFSFSASSWGDWICTTNGWVFDTANGGWWKLTNPGFTPLYCRVRSDGTAMWTVANNFTSGAAPIIAQYNYATPGNAYTWQSYPLTQTKDRNISIQEVIVRAQGVGTVTLTFAGSGGTTAVTLPTPVNVNSAVPVSTRMNVGSASGQTFQTHNVTVNIASTGTGGGPAPVVYSVSIGFLESAPINPV